MRLYEVRQLGPLYRCEVYLPGGGDEVYAWTIVVMQRMPDGTWNKTGVARSPLKGQCGFGAPPNDCENLDLFVSSIARQLGVMP